MQLKAVQKILEKKVNQFTGMPHFHSFLSQAVKISSHLPSDHI